MVNPTEAIKIVISIRSTLSTGPMQSIASISQKVINNKLVFVILGAIGTQPQS